MKMKNHLIGAIAILVLLTSCNENKDIKIPDTSAIELDYKIIRFEQLMSKIDTNNIKNEFDHIKTAYPAFTDLYFNRIVPLSIEGEFSDAFYNNLKGFLGDERIRFLLDTVELLFPDLENTIRKDLDKAFKNTKFYFPEFSAPNVYTIISEYAYQQFLFEDDNSKDGLGLGLDLYLGRSFPYKSVAPGLPAFSEYITRTFDRNHMVKKIMDIILDDIVGPSPGTRMIDQMIHNGKKTYILNHILPETPDSVLMEYTSDQAQWVTENEEQMWAFFFKENLFYETNMMKINKYISTSPNSPNMPEEAPGMTGNYMGWQIIKAYMTKFPDTSLKELVEDKDMQKIMDDSKYKPKRRN